MANPVFRPAATVALVGLVTKPGGSVADLVPAFEFVVRRCQAAADRSRSR